MARVVGEQVKNGYQVGNALHVAAMRGNFEAGSCPGDGCCFSKQAEPEALSKLLASEIEGQKGRRRWRSAAAGTWRSWRKSSWRTSRRLTGNPSSSGLSDVTEMSARQRPFRARCGSAKKLSLLGDAASVPSEMAQRIPLCGCVGQRSTGRH